LFFIPGISWITYVYRSLKLIRRDLDLLQIQITNSDHENLKRIIGEEFITSSNFIPVVDTFSGKQIVDPYGTEYDQPMEEKVGYAIEFGNKKLVYWTMEDALRSSYSIAKEGKCTLSGICSLKWH